jgi:hypothetical protein
VVRYPEKRPIAVGIAEANKCPTRRLFARYIKHAQQQGARRRSIETKISMFLDKLIGPDLKKLKANYTFCDKRDGAHGIEHGNVYEFPPLKACRERFAEKIGQDIAWDNSDEEWRHEDDDMVIDDELVW